MGFRRGQALERKIAELGGRKMLYSQNFFSRDEFWGSAVTVAGCKLTKSRNGKLTEKRGLYQGSPWEGVMPKEREYQVSSAAGLCAAYKIPGTDQRWLVLRQRMVELVCAWYDLPGTDGA
eukprot:3386104-Rhodomonas_salina.1